MAREQIMAAGGIVLRREQPPRIAVVRLRKRDEWVLPKGKLDEGESPRDAAKREVLEETGHSVTVHEFLGTLVVDTGTRAKIVHYWRMEANDEATRPLMDDIRSVDWLPLDQAVERLSRSHEKTFLENVGPYALAGLIRRTKAKPADEEKAAPSKPAAAKSVAKSIAAAKPAAAKAAAAKPVTARKRRPPVVEPAAPGTAPEATPLLAEIARIETTSAPEHGATAEAPEGLPAMSSHESVASEPEFVPVDTEAPAAETTDAETVEVETVEIETVGVETLGAAADGAPGENADVERVQAVAARIKSMTSEAASRIAQPRNDDKERDEPPQRAPAAPDASAETDASAPVRSDAAEPQESVSATADRAEPQRRSLAQKVRRWFGRAA